MSLVVDTSFFVALKSLRDANHGRAVELFEEILKGERGTAHTTNLVFSEAVTAVLARTHRHGAAVGVGDLVLLSRDGSPLFPMHHVTAGELLEAWREFRRFRDRELSITDWTSVVVARALEAEAILSFDRGFDGIFPRQS